MGKSDIKKLKNIINNTRSSLLWHVVEHKKSDYDDFTIRSDFQTKTHDIYYPIEQYSTDSQKLMGFLHELCHATLSEKVHHQFSTYRFCPGTSPEAIKDITRQCKTASDWFVDAHLNKICPEFFQQEIYDDLMLGMRAYKENQEEFWATTDSYSAALVYAESIKWLNAPITSEGIYQAIINGLMAVDPTRPTLASLEQLINSLLTIETDYMIKAVYVEKYQTELFELQEIIGYEP